MKGKLYKNTPRTIEQLKDAIRQKDSSRQRRHFGKSIPEFGETHSSVLGCERRPVSALIMSRSCFASFLVCVYKFSNHYLSNIIFLIDNSLGPLARDSLCSTILAIVFTVVDFTHRFDVSGCIRIPVNVKASQV